MTKLTDDIRILLALKHGATVRDFYKAGYGWSHRPEYWSAIQEQADEDSKWHRAIGNSAIWRCVRAGLIVQIPGPDDGHNGHSITFALTDAGRSAAAAIDDIPIEKALAPPKRAPVPEGLDRWGEYHWKIASKALKDMVRRGWHLEIERRGPKDEISFYALTTIALDYCGGPHLHPEDMKFLEPFVEPADLGIVRWRKPVECLVANAVGIELVTKRQLLPVPPPEPAEAA